MAGGCRTTLVCGEISASRNDIDICEGLGQTLAYITIPDR